MSKAELDLHLQLHADYDQGTHISVNRLMRTEPGRRGRAALSTSVSRWRRFAACRRPTRPRLSSSGMLTGQPTCNEVEVLSIPFNC